MPSSLLTKNVSHDKSGRNFHFMYCLLENHLTIPKLLGHFSGNLRLSKQTKCYNVTCFDLISGKLEYNPPLLRQTSSFFCQFFYYQDVPLNLSFISPGNHSPTHSRAREKKSAPLKNPITPSPQPCFSADPLWQKIVQFIVQSLISRKSVVLLRSSWRSGQTPRDYCPRDQGLCPPCEVLSTAN